MSEKVYIQDDYGNNIPLLDNYGNLSMQVIMLYAEDKLNETDRKTVDAYAATDEMSRDALDGYAKSTNVSRTRHHYNELNKEIQEKTGAAPIPTVVYKDSKTDYRKIAAGVAALIVIGTGTYFTAQYFSKPELADGTSVEETEAQQPQQQYFEPRKEEAIEAEEAPVLEDVAEAADELPNENAFASSADVVADDPEPVGKAKFRAVEKADEAEKKKEKPQDTPTESVLAAKKETTPPPVTATKNADAGAARPVTELAQEQAAAKAEETQRMAKELAASKASEEQARKESKRKEAERAAMFDREQAEMVAAEVAVQENTASEDRSQTAKYPGGDIAMYKFIEKKKVYTDDMRNQNIKGVVQVQFDISADGQVTNVKLKSSSSHAPFNEDALRVVNAMPKWKPAKNGSGENTSSSRTVVIKYGD